MCPAAPWDDVELLRASWRARLLSAGSERERNLRTSTVRHGAAGSVSSRNREPAASGGRFGEEADALLGDEQQAPALEHDQGSGDERRATSGHLVDALWRLLRRLGARRLRSSSSGVDPRRRGVVVLLLNGSSSRLRRGGTGASARTLLLVPLRSPPRASGATRRMSSWRSVLERLGRRRSTRPKSRVDHRCRSIGCRTSRSGSLRTGAAAEPGSGCATAAAHAQRANGAHDQDRTRCSALMPGEPTGGAGRLLCAVK